MTRVDLLPVHFVNIVRKVRVSCVSGVDLLPPRFASTARNVATAVGIRKAVKTNEIKHGHDRTVRTATEIT